MKQYGDCDVSSILPVPGSSDGSDFLSSWGELVQSNRYSVLLFFSFFSFSIYCLALAFEHYRQVYIVHSGLQDESLQVTIFSVSLSLKKGQGAGQKKGTFDA